MAHRGVDPCLRLGQERRQGRAHLLRAEAELREPVFRAGETGFDEDRLVQRHQPVLIGERLGVVAGKRRMLELGAEPGRHVRGDRDAAHPAVRVEAERGRVLARKLDEVAPAGCALLAHPLDLAGGVLDADDAGKPRQFAHRLRGHVDHRARRDVVDDDGKVAGIVHRLEMGDETALRGLVVIGRDDERRVRARLLGMLDEGDALRRVVRACAGDHRHPAGGGLHHFLDHAAMFLVRKGRAFAGGADGNKAVGALGDMPVHECLERVEIQCAVPERRDEGDEGPFEHDTLPAVLGETRPLKSRGTYRAARPLPSLCVAAGGAGAIFWKNTEAERKMTPKTLRAAPLALALLVFLSPAARADDPAAFRAALAAAEAKDWPDAVAKSRAAGSLAAAVIDWQRLRDGKGGVDEYLAFVHRHPDLPGLTLLREQGERVIAEDIPAATVIAWFTKARPQTGTGSLALIAALRSAGQEAAAKEEAVRAWRTLAMTKVEHELFLARHGDWLKDHHDGRIAAMLRDGNSADVKRMLPLASPYTRAVAEARVALQTDADGIDALLAALPEKAV